MKILLATAMAALATNFTLAQDSTTAPLQISGSVDTYWKYDLANPKDAAGKPVSNIGTSFAGDQNSVSLGMIDIALKKTAGKASFAGEVSFGPHGQAQSIPNSADGNSFHIQNLYVNYAFSEKFSMTAGYMGTFVGYELIQPAGNFQYSTSYLFTNGPFQNAGIKATYAFSPKVSLMAGLFNDWNVYQDFNGVSHFGAQLMVAPVEGWTAYLNMLTGTSAGGTDAYTSGTVLDLTTNYQVSDKFTLGLNAADYSLKNDGGFSGVAIYPKWFITRSFGLGLRAEYFKSKTGTAAATFSGVPPDESITAVTLSANLKSGGLTFIPEFRLDNGSASQFFRESGAATKSAAQVVVAVVYAF
jgi:hypothetical protein